MGRRLIKLRMPRMFAVSFLSCRLHNDADVVSGQRRQVGSRDIPTSGEIPATSRPIEFGRRRVGEAEAPTPRPPPTSPDQTIHATKKKTTTTTTPTIKTKTKSSTESTNTTVLPTTTASSTDSPCFFSTDEEEVTLRKTSLKHPSFSDSDSESDILLESLPRRTSKRKTSTTTRRRRKPRCINQSSASKKLPAMTTKGKVEESVAVTKRSTDPYADFRSSMVEMIVEKELLQVEELYQLLHCFLSLNSPRYHRIIIDAFEEICEALFRNWC